MEYRRLGNSGLQVSKVGIGCNNFGMRCDAAQAKQVVEAALDAGINFFDTADIYGAWADNGYPGLTEDLMGRWFAQGGGRVAAAENNR